MFGQNEQTRRCFVISALLTSLLAPTAGWGQQPSASTLESRLASMFVDIEREIARRQQAGERDAAGAFQKQLAALRASLEGEQPLRHSDQIEVHAVTVQEGTAAPPNVLDESRRFTFGYVEVEIQVVGRPIILLLCGEKRIHWQIKLADDAHVFAVVLSGKHPQELAGLPPQTLVLRRIYDDGGTPLPSALRFGDQGHQALQVAVRQETGRALKTIVAASRATTPLVVGPANRAWRGQYLWKDIVELHAQASRFDQQQQFTQVTGLRFRGIHKVASSPQGFSMSEGLFTVLGPIQSELRPIKNVRCLVHHARLKKTFALVKLGEFVVRDPNGNDIKVPVPELSKTPRWSSMTLDTKRDRLVLSEVWSKTMFAYDLSTARWTKLGTYRHHFSALVYVPAEDVLYATPPLNFGRGSADCPAEIVRFDADAKDFRRIAVKDRSRESPAALTEVRFGGTYQLAFADGFLVVVSPVTRDARSDRPDVWTTRIHAVDLAKGEVAYSGISTPQTADVDAKSELRGTSPTVSKTAKTNVPKVETTVPEAAKKGMLHRLIDGLAAAERGIDSLNQRGLDAGAWQQGVRLADARNILLDRQTPDKFRPPLLQVVGSYQGGLTVEVTDRSGPIVLALSAYDPSQWTVQVAQGVMLKRVIVGGYHRQNVQGVPDGIPVDIYTHEDRAEHAFWAYREDEREFEHARSRLRKLTGYPIAIAQFASHSRQKRMTVGPDSGAWRVERALAEIDGILAEIKGILGEADRYEREQTR